MTTPARFCLLVDPHQPEADLLAKCGLCGAITTTPLDATWLVGSVMCWECETAMPFDVATLDALGRQAVGAQSMIVRLLAKSAPRGR